MQARGPGYFEATVDGVPPGTRYLYRLDGEVERPDPASRSQPTTVHEPSEVVDPAFPWTDEHWHGLPLDRNVIYELHVGTFTPEGFWLAVGSGEALSEHVTGAAWPAEPERNARMKECAVVMRALWAGETVTHDGLVRVREAKLYTRPDRPPLLLAAALTEETARWAGGWADGLITVAGKPDALRKMVAAFREGGRDGKPLSLQVALSYARTDAEAARAAHREWRQAGLDGRQLADLRTPEEFAAACAGVTEADVRDRLRMSSDPGRHAEWLARDLELGFSAVYLHNLGRNQEEFIDVFADRVLPALR